MPRAFVFDAYGTLFDVHAAIARHRAAAGPDADRFSEVWRGKQLEYTWTLTLAGRYVDFWALTERALDFAFARVPSVDKALKPRLLDAYLMLDAFPDARAVLRELKRRGERPQSCRTARPKCSPPRSRRPRSAATSTPFSVDAIRIYKPRPEVYGLVTEHFKLAPWTSSSSHRTAGTSWSGMFGFRTVWSTEQTCRRNTGHRPKRCSPTSTGS